MTGPATTDYQQRLVAALRLRRVPAERIGEVVAEVDSHVAETGEDPAEVFGTPRAYAASLTHEHRRDSRAGTALELVSGALAGWFLAVGAVDLFEGGSHLGLPWWGSVLVGLLLGVPGGRRVAARARQVRDPRDGRALTPTARTAVLTVVGVLLLFAALVAGLAVALT
ncbi:hypothetical protein TEK04_14455 [Klenkia sp. LSe6-5]|uniref:DUF1707 domain-containing protein n=1 Tax=Klenkia sesuvii TaxID=3103137 RepID=A0ABU8DWS8_9ACTN